MTTQLHPAWRNQAHQRGIALVVALILLVIATLSGIAGIRNTILKRWPELATVPALSALG